MIPRAALVAIPILLAATPVRAQTAMTSYEQLQVFSGVLNQIRVNYVDSVNFGGLVRGAIEGMLGGLDPYSRYESRKDFDLRNAYERGELAGTGMWLEDADDAVVVLTVEPKGPADRAGVQPGDRVRTLDGEQVDGAAAASLQARLLGEKDSRIRLTLERGSRIEPDTFAVRLKRSIIEPRVVSGPHLVAPSVAYVRLWQFTPLAPKELRGALDRLDKIGGSGLILDLRGNPGGSIAALIEIAGLFLPTRAEIFRTEGRMRSARDTVETTRPGEFVDLPIVLLVDEGSASAAEILAGTLQDHDRAVVVGRTTFGKAVAQVSLPLPGGDIVWLTSARIVLPSGRAIQRQQHGPAADTTVFRTGAGRSMRGGRGIEPDIALERAALPAWFSAAADTGLIYAVADSVAQSLSAAPAGLATWTADTAAWNTKVTTPFLRRTRADLGLRAEVSDAVRARIGRVLARRVAEVRWGPEAGERFAAVADPDVAAAVAAMLESRAAPGRLGVRP